MRGRAFGVAGAVIVLAALLAFYLIGFLFTSPTESTAAISGPGGDHLILQTVPSYGQAPKPDWVSYLAQDASGHWRHSTIYTIPAHTTISVTLYQYDTATGLRNPFLAQVRGTQGGTATADGKSFATLNPDLASHTFTVPDLGISVPLAGVADDAKNQCTAAPCPLSDAHVTITFTFMSPAKGTYRWQCFVPCALDSYLGFGGPMQTIGWMSGYFKVV
jgi:hypothetical protein